MLFVDLRLLKAAISSGMFLLRKLFLKMLNLWVVKEGPDIFNSPLLLLALL